MSLSLRQPGSSQGQNLTAGSQLVDVYALDHIAGQVGIIPGPLPGEPDRGDTGSAKEGLPAILAGVPVPHAPPQLDCSDLNRPGQRYFSRGCGVQQPGASARADAIQRDDAHRLGERDSGVLQVIRRTRTVDLFGSPGDKEHAARGK